MKERLDRLGDLLVGAFRLTGLFVIGATIVWSALHSYTAMMRAGHAKLDDILLLFIYLELGAMVGIYFKTERLPVLFLLYIAITAMTRFLAVDVQEFAVQNLLIVTASIIGLALAVLVLQVAGSRFATSKAEATKVL